jgi:hypothetical protein
MGTLALSTSTGNAISSATLVSTTGTAATSSVIAGATSTSTAVLPWTPTASGDIPIKATYTPSSGIWQTVWLESVPAEIYVSDLKVRADDRAIFLLVSTVPNVPGIVQGSVSFDGTSPSLPSLPTDSEHALSDLAREFGVSDFNRLKVGLGETVRVLLRRMPHRVLLRDTQSADGRLVERLARMRKVEVEVRPQMFFQAVAIIADLRVER